MAIFSLNCKGKLLVVNKPMVMGIINCTPDSYFAESRANDLSVVLEKAAKMIHEGAEILDIGGQSTRPGSTRLSASEEIERVVPAIQSIHQKHPDLIISIDTYYASVAEAAIEAGASIVNDVTGGSYDEKIVEVAAKHRTPYVCTHLPGTLEAISKEMNSEDVTRDVIRFFEEKLVYLTQQGVKDVIVDPGFGFGKSIEQNYSLLKNISSLKLLNVPILIGISRKSMVYKALRINAEQSLASSSALHLFALQHGVNFLRVHDVKEASECVQLNEWLK